MINLSAIKTHILKSEEFANFAKDNEDMFKCLFKMSSSYYKKLGRGFLYAQILSLDDYMILQPENAPKKLKYIPFDINVNPYLSLKEKRDLKETSDSLFASFSKEKMLYKPRKEGLLLVSINYSDKLLGLEEKTNVLHIFTRKGIKRN